MKQNNETRLAIIDGDSICYLASRDTIQESIDNVDKLIADILAKTGSTHYYLFLSKKPYFRHKINSDYKGKRKAPTLMFIKTLMNYLQEQYLAEAFKDVEADDMVAYVKYLHSNGKIPGMATSIVCAIDKDVLGQVPGTHLNYSKMEFITTSRESANKFLYIQTIMGDSTDNIKGIPGKGIAKATEILKDVDPKDYPYVCLAEYISKFQSPNIGIIEFQKTFQQVYMLRTPNDFLAAVGYIPKLQTPIQINT